MKFLHILLIYFFVANCQSQKSNQVDINKLEDLINIQQEGSFIEKLKKQETETRPVVFGKYIMDSLQREGEYMEMVHKLKKDISDSIKNKKGIVYKEEASLQSIKKNIIDNTNYYVFLFKGDSLYGGRCCKVSKELVYKRLATDNGDIETFITISKFQDQTNYDRGLLFNVVSYDVTNDREIDKKTFSCLGDGYDNITYYEGFETDGHSIDVKSYNYIEPELTIIEKAFTISQQDGLITLDKQSKHVQDIE